MSQAVSKPSQQAGPAWQIATLFPNQGHWSDSDYLSLTQSTNRLVELHDGIVEVLPMPKTSHQRIVKFLFAALVAFVGPRRLGEALFAPLRVRLRDGNFREPDIVFMLAASAHRIGEDYWDGADLVMEVVSDDDRGRDLVEKRREYAKAGIGEYWIVDPRQQAITVLKLSNRRYVEHGVHGPADVARSLVLQGFEVAVADVLAAGVKQ